MCVIPLASLSTLSNDDFFQFLSRYSNCGNLRANIDSKIKFNILTFTTYQRLLFYLICKSNKMVSYVSQVYKYISEKDKFIGVSD